MTRPGKYLTAFALVLTTLWSTELWAQESSKPPGADKPDVASKPSETKPDEAEPASRAGDEVRTPSQPSPEDIIKAFQRDRPLNRPVPPKKPYRSVEPQAASSSLLREGEFLNNLAGRLSRDGNWWTLVFESDSPDSPRPPMRLLPNQQVERLVRETQASKESPTFVVSGEVTLFESVNYLLLRKVLRRRSMGNLRK